VPGGGGERVDGGEGERALARAYFHIVFTLPTALGDIAYQTRP
jgi:hypothetical protein